MEIVRLRERASGIEPSAFPDRSPNPTASSEAVFHCAEQPEEILPFAENLAKRRRGRVWVERPLREETIRSFLPLGDTLKELDPDDQDLVRLNHPESMGLTVVGFPRFEHMYEAVSSTFPEYVSYMDFANDLAATVGSADYSLCIQTKNSKVVRSGPTTKATFGIQLEPTSAILKEQKNILDNLESMLSSRYKISDSHNFIQTHLLGGIPLESKLGIHIPLGHIKQPANGRHRQPLASIVDIISSTLPEEIYLMPATITNLPILGAVNSTGYSEAFDEEWAGLRDLDTPSRARELAKRGVDAVDRFGGQAIITTPYATELIRSPGFSLGRLAVKHGSATFLHIKY